MAYKIQDTQWFDRRPKGPVYPVEAIIYDDFEKMLQINFQHLGSLGFMVDFVPKDKWDWLMGSLSTQVSKLIEQAYKEGQRDAKTEVRKALGL
jgi:hypothetical protein